MWDQSRIDAFDMRIVPYDNGDKYGQHQGALHRFFASFCRYVGELGDFAQKHSVRQGRGELHCANGNRQVGRWHNDRLDGFCVSSDTTEGERYYGQFKDGALVIAWPISLKSVAGRRHGRGVIVFADGATFDGVFVKDARKGVGTMRWPNGDRLTVVCALLLSLGV